MLVALALGGAGALANGVKLLSGKTRPYVLQPDPPPLVRPHVDLTLPSGHAATSFAAALVLSLLVRRAPATAAFFALALAIAWSRVYVGVHYPSDVVLGAILGFGVGGATFVLAPRIRALRRPGAALRRSRREPPAG